MHSAGGKQPLGDRDVSLRPRAPGISGCESPPECRVVATPELPVNPAEADRFVERLVVGERCRLRRALLGQNEPDAFGCRRGGRDSQVRHAEASATRSSGSSTSSRYPAASSRPPPSAHVGDDQPIPEIDRRPARPGRHGAAATHRWPGRPPRRRRPERPPPGRPAPAPSSWPAPPGRGRPPGGTSTRPARRPACPGGPAAGWTTWAPIASATASDPGPSRAVVAATSGT